MKIATPAGESDDGHRSVVEQYHSDNYARCLAPEGRTNLRVIDLRVNAIPS